MNVSVASFKANFVDSFVWRSSSGSGGDDDDVGVIEIAAICRAILVDLGSELACLVGKCN